MSKLRKYRVIEQKLEQMAGPDVDGLWMDMRSRLDQHMPEEKEERRMLWWWRNSGIFLMVPVVIFGSAIFFTTMVLDNQNQEADASNNIPPGNVVPVTTDNRFDKVSPADQVDINTDNRQLPAAPGEEGQAESAAIRKTVSQVDREKRSTATPMMGAVPTTTNVASKVPENFRKANRINVSNSSRSHLLLTGTPDAGTQRFHFPAQPIVQQERAYRAAYVLPAQKVSPDQRSAYAGLNLVPYLAAPPVVLHQRRLVPGVTDTMTFPDGRLSYNKTAFAKKFIVGGAVNINMPLSSQEMSTVSLNGGKNKLVDYLPSVYMQYHFAPRFFVQSEFQAITPQYTPKLTLSSTTTPMGPNRKQVHSVQLSKLYYMNLPVSLHYRVLPNLYAGAGIQYAYLTRSMLVEENSTWQNGTNGWEMKTSTSKLHVKKNPEKEKEKFKTQSNPNNPTPVVPTPVDIVAQEFKSNDLRFTYDLNYYRRRFNAGIRMNIGINNYIDTEVSGTNIPVRDRNRSFQLYIRYNIWERKRS